MPADRSSDLWRFTCWLRQLASIKALVEEARTIGGGELSTALQQRIVNEALSDSAYVPDLSYDRRLLQALVRAAEEDKCELCNDLTERFIAAQLVFEGNSSMEQHGPSWCTKTFTYDAVALDAGDAAAQAPQEAGSLPGTITLHVSRNMLEGSTGCCEWSAGLRLAEFCLSNPQAFAGKMCLELGCGTGLGGVALSRTKAANIRLTDGNSASLNNCQQNLALNGVEVQLDSCSSSTADHHVPVQCFQRLWKDDWSDVGESDVVLGADVMYDPDLHSQLLSLVKALLLRGRGHARPPEAALLAGQVRNPATTRNFEAEAAAQGLQLEQLQFEPKIGFVHLVRDERLEDVNLYRITV